jgi:hypothetical protein
VPASFKIFIATIALMVIVVMVQNVRWYNGAADDSGIIVVPISIVIGAMVGIYLGVRFSSDKRKNIIMNRLGILGNSLLALWNLTILYYMITLLEFHI